MKVGDDDGALVNKATPKATRNHYPEYNSRKDDAMMTLAGIAGLALFALLHFLHVLPPIIPVFP